VQLGEKQDAVSAREKLSHYTAKMIASKAKAKMYHKNCRSSFLTFVKIGQIGNL
jgi:hypothetical protein